MAVRFKVQLHSRTHRLMTVWTGTTNEPREVQGFEFGVVTTGSDEDKAFWAATPVGKIELGIVNPEAVRELDLSKKYYCTLTPAED